MAVKDEAQELLDRVVQHMMDENMPEILKAWEHSMHHATVFMAHDGDGKLRAVDPIDVVDLTPPTADKPSKGQ